ncbi:MAG: DUF4126 domain-containing protein [Mariprofundales bacterium]
MDPLSHLSSTIALAMGASWASGINLYATILMLGLMGASGSMTLPPGLEVLTNPLVIMAAGVMYVVEFFADKIPGLDTSWDALHTFVRIPAGAMLAASAFGPVDPAVAVAAGLLGGGVSAATHATKSGSRVLINTSPEPFTNWAASIGEDIAVIAGLWTALHYPLLWITISLLSLALIIWLLPKLWRAICTVARKVANFFGGKKQPAQSVVDPPQ